MKTLFLSSNKILPISYKFKNYGLQVKKELEKNSIRVEIDNRTEKIGYKIREARNERIPYIVIVGEKEERDNNISVRSRKNGDEGNVNIEDLIKRILKAIETKEID